MTVSYLHGNLKTWILSLVPLPSISSSSLIKSPNISGPQSLYLQNGAVGRKFAKQIISKFSSSFNIKHGRIPTAKLLGIDFKCAHYYKVPLEVRLSLVILSNLACTLSKCKSLPYTDACQQAFI